MGQTVGTLASGGPFETVYVGLVLFDGDRIARIELYEPQDLDAGRARFEARSRV